MHACWSPCPPSTSSIGSVKAIPCFVRLTVLQTTIFSPDGRGDLAAIINCEIDCGAHGEPGLLVRVGTRRCGYGAKMGGLPRRLGRTGWPCLLLTEVR